MYRSIIKIVLLLSITFYSFGQDKWTNYNTVNTGDNGLLGGYVYCFLEHPNGSLWIGTAYGISIFKDGNWESVNSNDGLVENEIGDLALDEEGNVWIGYGSYHAGVSKYDGNSFTHYKKEDGLFSNKINDILVDKSGSIWFATGNFDTGGITKYEGNTWQNYSIDQGLPDIGISTIEEDTSGDIWIGTYGLGTYILSSNTISPFSWENNSTDHINAIHTDFSGNIWVAGDQVYKYSSDWEFINPFPSENSGAVVWDINSNEGQVYFSTSFGLSILEDNVFNFYDSEDNFVISNVITSLVTDNKLWVGSEEGLAYFENNEWLDITTNDGGLINNYVYSAFEDNNGNLWFCTEEGISQYDGISWINHTKSNNNSDIEWVASGLQDKDGTLWFGTVSGIYKYDHTTWEIFDWNRDEIFNGWAQDIAEDSEGNIWFASSSLLKFDGTNWTKFDDTNGFPMNTPISLFTDSQGGVWVGSYDGISFFNEGSFTHYQIDEAFSTSAPIWEIFEDTNGIIYAVSSSDLLQFEDGSWNLISTPNYWFIGAHCDNSNQIWLSAFRNGILKAGENQYENYTMADGLISNNINDIFRTREGDFYICTNQGITKIEASIQISEPLITSRLDNSNIDISVESSGFTKPYWFSLDGENYMQNDGLFENVSSNPCQLYVSNAYDTISVQLDCVLGQEVAKNNTAIFPNPFGDKINVDFEGITTGRIELFSLYGKRLRNIIIENKKTTNVYTEDIPSGIYLMVITSNGLKSKQKLVKR